MGLSGSSCCHDCRHADPKDSNCLPAGAREDLGWDDEFLFKPNWFQDEQRVQQHVEQVLQPGKGDTVDVVLTKLHVKEELGLSLRYTSGRLVIVEFTEDGAVARNNKVAEAEACSSQTRTLELGDVLIAVNGRITDEAMFAECKQAAKLHVRVCRRKAGFS
eukprot:TRINITY_DN110203_c0_g1_i1.p1 TRINITY_DN110203_c0_g1~~TRINITY_DN110203_c0_g1_i1.p1  ORF type:complete len:161 (+),score=22.96 TRINITY_DN110203_c0_g1_i1:122-604(+)